MNTAVNLYVTITNRNIQCGFAAVVKLTMAVDRDYNSDGYAMKFMIYYWSERRMLRLVIAKYKLTANLYCILPSL
jgi:hypothetical protein